MHYKDDGITVCDCLDSFPPITPITTAQLEARKSWKQHRIDDYPRGAKVIELRKLHPKWTLQNIADEVGRSKERVRRILKRANLETRGIKIRPPVPPCLKCGTLVPDTGKYTHNKYCSVECRSEETIELICTYCSGLYTLTAAQARGRQKRVTNGTSKTTYCNRSCSKKAYWDVAHGRTPNTFGYKLITSQGLKWEK